MCTCNTEIFKYTNITKQLIFERCGRTKETLTDTPRNKSCAGIWIPSKKTPCGLMCVMDLERNVIFEGLESDYFPPEKKIITKEKKYTTQPKVVRVKDKPKSYIVQKWLKRYIELQNQEPEEKKEETPDYVNPIEGYELMTPKEKMRARLKLPKRKIKIIQKETALSKLWKEMESYSSNEYQKYQCAVMCGIITKDRSVKIEITEKVEIKKNQEVFIDINNESDDDEKEEEEEEEEEEEWSEEEEEEEEETGLEEDFGDFALNDETTINF
jgi:hypothetical protein